MSLGLLCPGQGAQHARMLDLALSSPRGVATIAAAKAALGRDVRDLIGAADRMFENAVAQPLICTAQLATWAALSESLPRPAAIAGYGLGELACYGVSGALDAGALAAIARERAAHMNAAAIRVGNLMAQRGLRRGAVEALCRGRDAWIAVVTDDDACVIGGLADDIDALQSELQSAGAQTTSLRVGVAAHTPLLADAVEPLRAVLEHSPIKAPPLPVIAGIDGALVTTRERAINTLSAQLAQTIEWARCLDTLYERGCRVFLELGPGRALSRTALDRLEGVQARSVEEFDDLAAIVGWVQRALE